MERHFEGKHEAKLYKRYRPSTPQIVIDKIMQYVNEKHPGPLTLAIDAGCGSGQNTLGFAPYFQKVIGTDISPNMVAEIASDPTLPSNVSFLVSPAEQLPVENLSVDLVTAAQCFHWFDQEKFHQEMNRVLKPNGVVAIVGHDPEFIVDPNDEQKTEELVEVLATFLSKTGPYLRSAAGACISRYKNISLPYDDVVRENDVCYDYPVTLADFLGVIETFSHLQKFYEEEPELATANKNQLIEGLIRVLGVKEGTPFDEVPTVIRMQNFIMLGRKKSTN